jgi:hypothetical protein
MLIILSIAILIFNLIVYIFAYSFSVKQFTLIQSFPRPYPNFNFYEYEGGKRNPRPEKEIRYIQNGKLILFQL